MQFDRPACRFGEYLVQYQQVKMKAIGHTAFHEAGDWAVCVYLVSVVYVVSAVRVVAAVLET